MSIMSRQYLTFQFVSNWNLVNGKKAVGDDLAWCNIRIKHKDPRYLSQNKAKVKLAKMPKMQKKR